MHSELDRHTDDMPSLFCITALIVEFFIDSSAVAAPHTDPFFYTLHHDNDKIYPSQWFLFLAGKTYPSLQDLIDSEATEMEREQVRIASVDPQIIIGWKSWHQILSSQDAFAFLNAFGFVILCKFPCTVTPTNQESKIFERATQAGRKVQDPQAGRKQATGGAGRTRFILTTSNKFFFSI